MFRVNVETPSPDTIAGAMRSGGLRLTVEHADAVARRATAIGAQIAERELRTRVPDRRGERRGSRHYKSSFTSRRNTGASFPVTTSIGNNSDIANIIEGGSAPHLIQGNPLLVIPGREGRGGGLPNSFGRSRNTVVKSVNHPGTRPYRIVRRSVEQALRESGIRVRGTT